MVGELQTVVCGNGLNEVVFFQALADNLLRAVVFSEEFINLHPDTD